jgi:hypothetical protein
MTRRNYVLFVVAALAITISGACAPAATQAPAPQTGPVGQPVAAVELAPLCQGGGACQVPTAEQYQIGCVKKVPYTNVVVEPGTSFEVLDKSGDFTCNDSGAVVNGKQVLSCYGKELFDFDLKLTNTACGGGNLQAGTGQCQEGYGFDAAQQCCAPLGGESGSVVVRVELGPCPLPH